MKKNKNKCPKCGHDKTYTSVYRHDQGFIEEIIETCENCGRLKNHWAYGTTYVEDWKDMSYPPFRYRLKQFIKNLFKKRSKRSHKDLDEELPF